MSAFTKLIEFVGKLPEALQPEYRQLIDNYISERDRLQNERISTSQATTGTFEVVASWYADKLLNEINVGDTVECIRDCYSIEFDESGIIRAGMTLKVDLVFGEIIGFDTHEKSYSKEHFRKVSPPRS